MLKYFTLILGKHTKSIFPLDKKMSRQVFPVGLLLYFLFS